MNTLTINKNSIIKLVRIRESFRFICDRCDKTDWLAYDVDVQYNKNNVSSCGFLCCEKCYNQLKEELKD